MQIYQLTCVNEDDTLFLEYTVQKHPWRKEEEMHLHNFIAKYGHGVLDEWTRLHLRDGVSLELIAKQYGKSEDLVKRSVQRAIDNIPPEVPAEEYYSSLVACVPCAPQKRAPSGSHDRLNDQRHVWGDSIVGKHGQARRQCKALPE